MNVSEALEARRSIRYFQDRPVPEETLRAIVKKAQWAPSWANAQPWQVYIATGSKASQMRDNHFRNAQRGLRGKSDLETGHRSEWGSKANGNMRHWSNDLSSYLGYESGDQFPMSQAHLFDAPALVYLTMHKNSPLFSIFDMGAFSQSLMLAAKEEGVDSMEAYELVKYPEDIRRFMGIPEDEAIVIGIALGYADDRRINGFRSNREDLDAVLTILSE
jgi:nitroreductase